MVSGCRRTLHNCSANADTPHFPGLPTFATPNSFWYKVLFSYAPIAIGTAMEPILVCIGSANCMLSPYQALLSGRATAKVLTVDYDKSPPHFQFLRSMKAKNYKLAALSVAILLSNLFAIALTGLFSPTRVNLHLTTDVEVPTALTVTGGFLEDTHEMYYRLIDHLTHGRPPPTWTTPDYYVIPFTPVSSEEVLSYEATTIGLGLDIKCALVPSESINLTWFNGTKQSYPRGQNMWTNYVGIDDPCWRHKSKPILEPNITNTRYGWRPPTRDALLESITCPGTLFALWLERPGDPSPVSQSDPYQNRIDVVMLKCTTIHTVVQLTANVSQAENVNSVSNIRPLDASQLQAVYPHNSINSSLLAATFIAKVVAGTLSEPSPGRHQMRWIDHLMMLVDSSIVIDHSTNITHLPNTTNLAQTFERVYRRLFAINVRHYAADILSPGPRQIAPGRAVVRSFRVNVSRSMFYLSSIILVFIMAVLVILYYTQQQHVIGHLPTSLAGMYAHLYASNSQEECGRVEGKNPEERGKALEALGLSYRYGWFPDGGHVGVYRLEEEIQDRSSWKGKDKKEIE